MYVNKLDLDPYYIVDNSLNVIISEDNLDCLKEIIKK